MAYTIVREMTVLGNKRVALLDITADATTQSIDTGLARIDHFTVGLHSMTTQIGHKLVPNKTASGATSPGTLGASALASGDRLFVTVYGV
jgi:hypothetical protein